MIRFLQLISDLFVDSTDFSFTVPDQMRAQFPTVPPGSEATWTISSMPLSGDMNMFLVIAFRRHPSDPASAGQANIQSFPYTMHRLQTTSVARSTAQPITPEALATALLPTTQGSACSPLPLSSNQVPTAFQLGAWQICPIVASVYEEGSFGQGYRAAQVLIYFQNTGSKLEGIPLMPIGAVDPIQNALPFPPAGVSDRLLNKIRVSDFAGFSEECKAARFGYGESPTTSSRTLYYPPDYGFFIFAACRVPNGSRRAKVQFEHDSQTSAQPTLLSQIELPLTEDSIHSDGFWSRFPRASGVSGYVAEYSTSPIFSDLVKTLPDVGETTTVHGIADITLISTGFDIASLSWIVKLRIENLGSQDLVLDERLDERIQIILGDRNTPLFAVHGGSTKLNPSSPRTIAPRSEGIWEFHMTSTFTPDATLYAAVLLFALSRDQYVMFKLQ